MAQSRKFQVTCDPIDVTPAPIRSYVLSTEHDDAPLLASPRRREYFLRNSVRRRASHGTRPMTLAANETKPQEPDTDIFALMSGKCTTLKIAGRDFACRSVAFFHSERGRTNFTVALDDPNDDSHVVSFSGDNGRREQDNLYELPVDRMLLSSKDRPKVDGLPVPFVEGIGWNMQAAW